MKYQVTCGNKVLGNFAAHDPKEAIGKAIAFQFTYNPMFDDPDTVFTVKESGKNVPAVTFTRKEI